jgi:PAS domain S-box-containing protein
MNTLSERGSADCVSSMGSKVVSAPPTHNESNVDDTTLRLVVESVPNALVLANASGSITMVNSQAENLFGYARSEFLGQSVEMLVPHRYRGKCDGFFQYPNKTAGNIGRDCYGLRKDGTEIPVEIALTLIQMPEGCCVLAAILDISERLQFQETLRALPKRLLDAQEAERRRIALELHDEVGQALTASQIKLRALEAKLHGKPEVKDVGEVVGILNTLLQQVRQLSLDLRPSVLDDLGLAAAIRWFVRERVNQGRLDVKLDVPLTLPRFPMRIEIAVFRALQSIMTNTLRHAEAGHIWVALRFEAPLLFLDICDDGKGFDIAAAEARARQGESLGLLGMREWVRLSGGEMTIESSPGWGTRVKAVINVDDNDHTRPGGNLRGGSGHAG